ncbi:MAG: YraN family protein [Acidobacteria bacterium]|nr:YraN family protein [Acidobacteriota bacterium]
MPLGRRGEDIAERHLRRSGYRILERGFRTRFGEIDLVAEESGEIVFVEVKTRRGPGFGEPEEAVDGRKRRRLARLAVAYRQRRGCGEQPCRFDVVAVLLGEGGRPERIRVVRDAFPADGSSD